MTGPICLVVGAKCGSKLGISSFICMVIPIFLPPPPHSDWGWCNSIPIWNMSPAPGPAECLIHNWLTLTFSQQSRCPSLQTVHCPVTIHIRVPVMMFSQWLIINTEFLIVILMRTDTRPSQANNVNQLSQLCSNQQSLPCSHTWEYFKFTW